jgi:hypothetical protein
MTQQNHKSNYQSHETTCSKCGCKIKPNTVYVEAVNDLKTYCQKCYALIIKDSESNK